MRVEKTRKCDLWETRRVFLSLSPRNSPFLHLFFLLSSPFSIFQRPYFFSSSSSSCCFQKETSNWWLENGEASLPKPKTPIFGSSPSFSSSNGSIFKRKNPWASITEQQKEEEEDQQRGKMPPFALEWRRKFHIVVFSLSSFCANSLRGRKRRILTLDYEQHGHVS